MKQTLCEAASRLEPIEGDNRSSGGRRHSSMSFVSLRVIFGARSGPQKSSNFHREGVCGPYMPFRRVWHGYLPRSCTTRHGIRLQEAAVNGVALRVSARPSWCFYIVQLGSIDRLPIGGWLLLAASCAFACSPLGVLTSSRESRCRVFQVRGYAMVGRWQALHRQISRAFFIR